MKFYGIIWGKNKVVWGVIRMKTLLLLVMVVWSSILNGYDPNERQGLKKFVPSGEWDYSLLEKYKSVIKDKTASEIELIENDVIKAVPEKISMLDASKRIEIVKDKEKYRIKGFLAPIHLSKSQTEKMDREEIDEMGEIYLPNLKQSQRRYMCSSPEIYFLMEKGGEVIYQYLLGSGDVLGETVIKLSDCDTHFSQAAIAAEYAVEFGGSYMPNKSKYRPMYGKYAPGGFRGKSIGRKDVLKALSLDELEIAAIKVGNEIPKSVSLMDDESVVMWLGNKKIVIAGYIKANVIGLESSDGGSIEEIKRVREEYLGVIGEDQKKYLCSTLETSAFIRMGHIFSFQYRLDDSALFGVVETSERDCENRLKKEIDIPDSLIGEGRDGEKRGSKEKLREMVVRLNEKISDFGAVFDYKEVIPSAVLNMDLIKASDKKAWENGVLRLDGEISSQFLNKNDTLEIDENEMWALRKKYLPQLNDIQRRYFCSTKIFYDNLKKGAKIVLNYRTTGLWYFGRIEVSGKDCERNVAYEEFAADNADHGWVRAEPKNGSTIWWTALDGRKQQSLDGMNKDLGWRQSSLEEKREIKINLKKKYQSLIPAAVTKMGVITDIGRSFGGEIIISGFILPSFLNLEATISRSNEEIKKLRAKYLPILKADQRLFLCSSKQAMEIMKNGDSFVYEYRMDDNAIFGRVKTSIVDCSSDRKMDWDTEICMVGSGRSDKDMKKEYFEGEARIERINYENKKYLFEEAKKGSALSGEIWDIHNAFPEGILQMKIDSMNYNDHAAVLSRETKISGNIRPEFLNKKNTVGIRLSEIQRLSKKFLPELKKIQVNYFCSTKEVLAIMSAGRAYTFQYQLDDGALFGITKINISECSRKETVIEEWKRKIFDLKEEMDVGTRRGQVYFEGYKYINESNEKSSNKYGKDFKEYVPNEWGY